MGSICCDEHKKQIVPKDTLHLIKIDEEKDDIENNNIININNISNNNTNNKNNIIVYKFNSIFKNQGGNEEQNIKNKNTIKNINRRMYLIKKYKFVDDKFEKHIKFTHFNKIISSTTNSFIK